jgi:processive 1,2-diacylglycerol beta-glucosyltransferase
MKKQKRILILSVAIGAGHIKTGEALCRAYQEYFNGEARHIDFMRYALPGISSLVETAYYFTTKYIPPVYQWLYHLEDRKHSLLRNCESRIAIQKYRQLVQILKPDAIISTHSFPAVVVSQTFSRFPIPNAVVLTDYTAHHIWVNPHTQLYFVAHAGMVDELKSKGVAADKIKVTGIPVRLAFRKSFYRRELQQKLKLAPDRLTLLLMSGGNAIGPMQEVIRHLARLGDQIQFIAITGRNQRLHAELQTVFSDLSLKGKVLPFVDDIEEYMAVSDLVISKAGGLTVTESLVMGLPMFIIRPTPGQEYGNTQFLEECGAGIHVKRTNDLAGMIEDFLNHPLKLEQMRQKALQMAKPAAAEGILSTLEKLMEGVGIP